ncbi:hypothetical protein [Veillonella magna]|uniref:hypothetical protein n=1 Tax=Veillonella magna TaxID=464322 RepID=UPI0026653801|nr:hypothetical protein [Veillonella magna]
MKFPTLLYKRVMAFSLILGSISSAYASGVITREASPAPLAPSTGTTNEQRLLRDACLSTNLEPRTTSMNAKRNNAATNPDRHMSSSTIYDRAVYLASHARSQIEANRGIFLMVSAPTFTNDTTNNNHPDYAITYTAGTGSYTPVQPTPSAAKETVTTMQYPNFESARHTKKKSVAEAPKTTTHRLKIAIQPLHDSHRYIASGSRVAQYPNFYGAVHDASHDTDDDTN